MLSNNDFGYFLLFSLSYQSNPPIFPTHLSENRLYWFSPALGHFQYLACSLCRPIFQGLWWFSICCGFCWNVYSIWLVCILHVVGLPPYVSSVCSLLFLASRCWLFYRIWPLGWSLLLVLFFPIGIGFVDTSKKDVLWSLCPGSVGSLVLFPFSVILCIWYRSLKELCSWSFLNGCFSCIVFGCTGFSIVLQQRFESKFRSCDHFLIVSDGC